MSSEMVRLNITLPKKVAEELAKYAGPRKQSRFIADAIRERLDRADMEALEKKLEEGYRTRAGESVELAREFESVDVEGWDDY